jgi:hypothetical protein
VTVLNRGHFGVVIIMVVGNENLMDVSGLVMNQRQLPNHAIARIDQVGLALHDQQIGRLGPLACLPRAALRA